MISYMSVMQGSHYRQFVSLVAALVAACSLFGDGATAEDYSIGTLQIGNPWTRATPKGAAVAGGYMKITNKGSASDRLVGGTAAVAGRFEVHSMVMEQGVAKMRPLKAVSRSSPARRSSSSPVQCM